MNKQEALELVRKDGLDLIYIPEKLRTKEICLVAVESNGLSLRYVPEELKTKELCIEAIKQNGSNLKFVPEELKDKELCLIAVRSNIWSLQYVPEKLINKELCLIAVRQDAESLKYIPDDIKEELKDICFKIYTSHRSIYVIKLEDGTYRFSIGCQINITKEKFINRIYHDDENNYVDNALEIYPYRQEYLNILENY